MERLCQSSEMAELIPPVELDARVVYFPIRHHSPACAWHIDRLIRDWQPDAVLIEGPRDATTLAPLLLHEETRLPVAIFTTYIKRKKEHPPEHYAAYYPFCDYSPEYAAIKTATAIGARVKFIDLTFPEQIAYRQWPDGKVQSLLDERYLRQSRFLQAACQRTGMRDADDLWDHLYEDDYQRLSSEQFMRHVLAYCALARKDYSNTMLQAEGCLAREQAMASAIAEEDGRVIVVTGGFHSIALPGTKPQTPKPLTVIPEDALVVLTRYSFDMLDSLNGYCSGMPSPEFYQRRWEGQPTAQLIVDIGRRIREQGGEISADDEISALTQATRLANFRGHHALSREDLLDGIRSSFIKGAVDVEGVLVLTHARNILAGSRVGVVSKAAGLPPIVWDFRETAVRFRLKLDGLESYRTTLDLYRKEQHRLISRFLHRLRYLNTPFASCERGPDFVLGENLDRMQEVWNYRWSPMTESHLVEMSMYGGTLEQAAIACLWASFSAAEEAGEGGRARQATALIMEACRMGLHQQAQQLLEKTSELIAQDAQFPSLVAALNDVLLLLHLREPLEAGEMHGLQELATAVFRRACFLLQQAGSTPEEEEEAMLEALNSLDAAREILLTEADDSTLFQQGLQQIIDAAASNTVLRGGAVGVMASNGWMEHDALLRQLHGHLSSTRDEGTAGIKFIHGLLACYRSLLWQSPEIISGITSVLQPWDEAHFLQQLPLLRLTFASLTPRECDKVAQMVSEHLGTATFTAQMPADISPTELLYGMEVNRRITELLQGDGLIDLLREEAVHD